MFHKFVFMVIIMVGFADTIYDIRRNYADCIARLFNIRYIGATTLFINEARVTCAPSHIAHLSHIRSAVRTSIPWSSNSWT
ncbi:uncharacterized protein [Amphiura filiformis]|uniref:uncharacterized protein isoform X2 n=1 Tax=Amphiura filiformis TaxID=82378 RepID=UPI003B225410